MCFYSDSSISVLVVVGLRRSVSTMDDCALAGRCGRTTARTASTMTDEADPGTTGSATVGVGVSGRRVVTRRARTSRVVSTL